MAFGLLNQTSVTGVKKFFLLAGAILVAGGTVGLSFLSFTREVETFVRAGFTSQRAAGSLILTAVEPDGAAAQAGLQRGDRIITADGVSAGSLPLPEKALARPEFPHVLVIQRGEGDIRRVLLGKPAASIDWKYLFLAFVGLLYLFIGFFTLARERTASARVFWAICLSSFAIDVLTRAGPHDTLWKAFWVTEDVYRAILPALLLHFFLVFPEAPRRHWIPLLYVPGAAYLALQESPFFVRDLDAARTFLWAGRLWQAMFAVYGAILIARLIRLLRQPRGDAQAEKQVRWIGLGIVVGLSPFLVFSVLPEALGVATPWLSKMAVLPLVVIPLAFSYAILRWRLWDVEIFVREALATTAAVLLCGATFVVLNALLDRTLEGMADAGKNVVAFGSGLVLASMLVPMKKRITDVLEKIQYHETYRARRALLDFARDFSTPRPQEEVVAAISARAEDGLHVVPCRLFLFDREEGPETDVLRPRLQTQDVWHLRGASFGLEEPAAAERLHEAGFRTFFAMRCAGTLAGALGVGHKDGRVPLSSEDESLLTALMAQGSLAYENARLYGALAERLDEIRTLQQYQESVILSSSSGIVVLDGSNRVHSANPAFAALVGRPETALIGLALEDVLPGIVLPEADASGERTGELAIVNERDEERDLRVSVSQFQGDPQRKVVLVDDVTDRIRAERALAERERLASLGVLAAGVAHEVNTPIAGLSSYAQMLLADTPPGDPRYKILKKMERQTFRAAHLVSNLLEFARPRAAANVRTDLRSVVSNAAESVETTMGTRQLVFEMTEQKQPLWVMGDPRELEQVFVNLFTNARDASPERGEVHCRLEACGEKARVVISDRGPGLSAAVRDRLFQPFFTTKTSGGTGLGLAISREIVRRHGGEMGLDAREGGGVAAWVTLPIAAVQVS